MFFGYLQAGREQCGCLLGLVGAVLAAGAQDTARGAGGLCWAVVLQPSWVPYLLVALTRGPHASPRASISSSVKWTQGSPCHSGWEEREDDAEGGLPHGVAGVAPGQPGAGVLQTRAWAGPAALVLRAPPPPLGRDPFSLKLERQFWPPTFDSIMRSQEFPLWFSRLRTCLVSMRMRVPWPHLVG